MVSSFEFEATQTPNNVTVRVTLPSGIPTPDIFITDVYLKLSSSNYVTFVDFNGTVDDSTCRAAMEKGARKRILAVTVAKITPGLWEPLMIKLSKPELFARREEANQRYAANEQQRAKAETEAQRLRGEEERKGRAAVDTSRRDDISRAKAAHLDMARDALEGAETTHGDVPREEAPKAAERADEKPVAEAKAKSAEIYEAAEVVEKPVVVAPAPAVRKTQVCRTTFAKTGIMRDGKIASQ